ncbi:hypothetical protein HELRODRAFT_171192 [Helobdella robusta]|uniref:Receptor ligand binding region domain-containing protein n=1 Tax=Helobdella robusta TaxID=6412 RepID=T1F3X2_HELRO|nr:hypothetical protein HELRODRAFT_171192 [Helobdella robusta]ESO05552.1 hypothetical protein HELRODRAFT_171192 [Helobdella robusta]
MSIQFNSRFHFQTTSSPPSPSPNTDNLLIGMISSSSNINLVETVLGNGYSLARQENIYNGTYKAMFRVLDACDGMASMRETLNLIQNDSVNVIFGALCSANCIATAQAANYWNIPYFPLNCFDPSLDDSNLYSTIVRFFGSLTSFGASFAAYFKRYQWENVAIMIESEADFCDSALNAIQSSLRGDMVTVAEIVQLPADISSLDASVFLKIRRSARIIIVCHSKPAALRQIIFFAQDLGMTDPSQYVWITFYNIYLGLPFDVLLQPWSATNNNNQPDDDHRRKAFLALKIITYKNMTNISNIADDATQSLDDIFYLYLVLRNQTLSSNKDPESGSNILNSAKSNEIIDKSETLKFNPDGDRLMNFYVWSLAPGATTFGPYMEINLTNESTYSVGTVIVVSGGLFAIKSGQCNSGARHFAATLSR